jgi:hypothetical protein
VLVVGRWKSQRRWRRLLGQARQLHQRHVQVRCREASEGSQFAQVYQDIWGEPETENYLIKAVNEGLNVWEFALQERQKPAFAQTNTFKDVFSRWAELLQTPNCCKHGVSG